MNSPVPITVAGMIGALPGAWRARAFGIPIALAGWRTVMGFWAKSLLKRRDPDGASAAAQSTLMSACHAPRLSVSPPWVAYGVVGLLAIGRTSGVHAEDKVPPVVDAADATGAGPKPLWEAGIGGFAGAVADYPGSNQYRVRGLPFPFFIYRGDFFSSDVNGPRLQKSSGIVEWELSGGGSLASNSTGGARAGMPNLDYLLEVGPKAKITVAKATDTSRLTVDVALREAISTNFSSRLRSQGVLLAPDVAYQGRAILGSRWGGRASIEAQFATAGLQRYYYEVEPQYARAGRPAYDARAGYLGATLALTAFRQVTRSFTVFAGLGVDNYDGAANVDSPLLRTRNDLGAVVGFAWSIGQSQQDVNRAR
jgi:outer membrane scaffolding protein for murein synthesis (MipA/OmpV family)